MVPDLDEPREPRAVEDRLVRLERVPDAPGRDEHDDAADEEREQRRSGAGATSRPPSAGCRSARRALSASGSLWATAPARLMDRRLSSTRVPLPAARHRDPSSSSLTVGGNSPTICALEHDEDAVGERQHLVELERDEQDRSPLVPLLDQAPVDELDRTDVETAGRLRGDQHARVAVDLAGEDHLLLVAAGERARLRLRARLRGRRTPRSAVARARRDGCGNSQPKREFGALAVVVQRDVLGDREVEHEAATLPILGNVTEAGVEVLRVRRRASRRRPRARSCPASGRRSPVIASISSVCPLPSTPAIPTISPSRTSKETPRTFSMPRSSRTCSSSTARSGSPGVQPALLDAKQHLAPDHEPREPLLGRARGRHRLDVPCRDAGR